MGWDSSGYKYCGTAEQCQFNIIQSHHSFYFDNLITYIISMRRLAMQQHSSLGLMAIAMERGWNSWIWYLRPQLMSQTWLSREVLSAHLHAFKRLRQYMCVTTPIAALGVEWGRVDVPHSLSGQMPPHFIHPRVSVGWHLQTAPLTYWANLLPKSRRA